MFQNLHLRNTKWPSTKMWSDHDLCRGGQNIKIYERYDMDHTTSRDLSHYHLN